MWRFSCECEAGLLLWMLSLAVGAGRDARGRSFRGNAFSLAAVVSSHGRVGDEEERGQKGVDGVTPPVKSGVMGEEKSQHRLQPAHGSSKYSTIPQTIDLSQNSETTQTIDLEKRMLNRHFCLSFCGICLKWQELPAILQHTDSPFQYHHDDDEKKKSQC